MTAFAEFMRFAHNYARKEFYSVASNCYLMAARFHDTREEEQLALTFSWWMHERNRGRISHSELNREDHMDTTNMQGAMAQGDGDPGRPDQDLPDRPERPTGPGAPARPEPHPDRPEAPHPEHPIADPDRGDRPQVEPHD